MKLQVCVFAIIIICNIVFGCDPTTKNCHEKSSRGPRDRKRGKRDPGSNLLEVSKGHGPYARFCNAMTIAYDLRYKINETIVPLAGELFNLDEETTNLLMSLDSNEISTFFDPLRNSLTLTKEDLDNIVKEMGEVNKLREAFNKKSPDQSELSNQYNFIKNVLAFDYIRFGGTHTASTTLLSYVKIYDSMTWNDQLKTEISNIADDLSRSFNHFHTESSFIHVNLVKLKDNRFNPSLFKSIREKGKAYNNFFETKRWSDAQDALVNDGKVFQLFDFVELSEVREEPMQTLKAIQKLIDAAEKPDPPKPFNRTWARAFVPGASDLELFEQELNGPKFRDLFQSEEDLKSMRNGFKQAITFGKAATSSRSEIFEKAKVQSLEDHVKELQDHLRKFDGVQTLEGLPSFAHLLNSTYNNPPPELVESSFQSFTALIDQFEKAKIAQEKLIETDKVLEESAEFQWLTDSTSNLDGFGSKISKITFGESSFNELKDDDRFKKLKDYLPKLINLLSNVKTDSEALKNEIQGLEKLEQETFPINMRIWNGFNTFMYNLDAVQVETLKVIQVANAHLGLKMDDYKKTFTDLHSSFFGEMKSIREKTESVPLPEEKDAIDLWEQYPYRILIEEKLIAGFLVYGYFHQVLSKEAEVLLFLNKSLETWVEASNVTLHDTPSEFFELTRDPEQAEVEAIKMFEDLKILEQKIAFTDTRELENWGHEIAFIDCPEINVADWIEANKLLKSTTVEPDLVKESTDSCKPIQDLNLDWAYHQTHAFTWIRGVERLRNFMHLFYKAKKVYEKPKVPPPMPLKTTHLKDPILIIILLLVLINTAYVASRVARYYTEKKYGKARRDFLAKKEKVITTEIAAELKIEREDFFSIQEMYDYREEVRRIWHQKKADPEKVKLRLHFRQLLEEARDKGTPFETTIREIAEEIQESYKEYRGPTRCRMENGNYFCNFVGNMVTLPDRLYRILRNNIPARKIWQFMTRRKFSILVDFQTLWYEDHQVELATDVRGKPNQYVVFWSEDVECPFKNVEIRKVVRNRSPKYYEMIYMRYQNFPVGFAPFELTPCQVIYEMIDEMRDEDGDDNVAVVCIDRDGDSRTCIMPMIDNMLHVMTYGDTFEDLYEIGDVMARQRRRSIDLLTTVQIEFCLYVCFKIINDESAAMKQPMFNEDKTEFLRQLEDAWASAWLRNYEAYEAHYQSQKMDRIYKPNDRDQHFYPQSKPHLEKMKESVIRMMERRRDYVMSKGEPDPYKKETKKEAEETKKNQ